MKRWAVYFLIVVNLAACAMSSNREVEQLRMKLREREVVAQLSAKNIEKWQKMYTDVYFELDSLTINSFKRKVARGETFYAYIGRPSCGDCQAFEPIFKRYIRQYHLDGKLYFVNVHFLQQDKAQWSAFKQQYNLQGTPTLAKYRQGKLVNKLDYEADGKITAQDIEQWLEKNQLLN